MESKTIQNNQEIYETLLSSVAEKVAKEGKHQKIIEYGPMEVNFFFGLLLD